MAEQFRRTDPRYDRKLDVEMVLDGNSIAAQSRNISLGGMFLQAPATPAMGAPVQIRFRVPTQAEPIEVLGTVQWVEAGAVGASTGMGIRFQGLRARDVWALNRYFQT